MGLLPEMIDDGCEPEEAVELPIRPEGEVGQSLEGSDGIGDHLQRRREGFAQGVEQAILSVESSALANAVNAAMEALPEELRMAITLREIEGLSYEEIAQALECPIGTVRSRIFRAREAISTRIKPLLDRPSGKRW